MARIKLTARKRVRARIRERRITPAEAARQRRIVGTRAVVVLFWFQPFSYVIILVVWM